MREQPQRRFSRHRVRQDATDARQRRIRLTALRVFKDDGGELDVFVVGEFFQLRFERREVRQA